MLSPTKIISRGNLQLQLTCKNVVQLLHTISTARFANEAAVSFLRSNFKYSVTGVLEAKCLTLLELLAWLNNCFHTGIVHVCTIKY